ncbi:mitochondrial proton/calcium exchanger protein-like [Uloborus diversus]|uniref:mitochondrial proton/calcium exchanger protein-like n=1 Tax=Uloborus diversus TaxID=327109 RepID=UPI002409991B|nr:mitochondrial proton/calcium exchanger protein-like [Uloborus diversus]
MQYKIFSTIGLAHKVVSRKTLPFFIRNYKFNCAYLNNLVLEERFVSSNNAKSFSMIYNHNFHIHQKRYFHSSSFIFAKEPSKIEETVKILKEEKTKHVIQEELKDKKVISVEKSAEKPAPKRSLMKRITDEIVHYYHGFRLLAIDCKVSFRLVRKMLNGDELTRREHKQLIRTVADLFRLLPFSIFIAVPFLELALPLFIKFFPQAMPSTFQTASEKEKKFKQGLKVKIETAKFLQETLDEMATVSKGYAHSETAKEFSLFFDKIRKSGEQPSNEDILRFSKLFEDEITLDSLSRPELIALCRLLELKPIGTNNFLTFQLRLKLRRLRADDVIIRKEGIDTLTVPELQAACRARGMRALGLSEERLKSQLSQWLELSLDSQIPPSLLLLSRALYLPEHLPAPDQLKATLSSLPSNVATEAKLKIGEMEGKVDNKTKLELIKQEEEAIKKETAERQQELLNEKKIAEPEKALDEELKDKAEPLVDHAKELEDTDAAVDKKQLSKEDFDELEDAIENIATEKKKLLIEKEEIEDLKEEMAEYKQDIEELKDIVLETGHTEIKQSKAAQRLSSKVNKMISKMDALLDSLNREKNTLQQQIDDKMKEGVAIVKERDDIISVNELVLAIRRIQKVSDDTKLQRIADVLEKMDVDRDGAVEVDHVLKVIELLGKDNVKVSVKQMEEIIDLLIKEDQLEMEEKMEKQKQLKEENQESKGKVEN